MSDTRIDALEQQLARTADELAGLQRLVETLVNRQGETDHVARMALRRTCPSQDGGRCTCPQPHDPTLAAQLAEARAEASRLNHALDLTSGAFQQAEADCDRYRRIYDLAIAARTAPHVDDADHAAGDCDSCPARLAKYELWVAVDAEVAANAGRVR